MKPEPLAYTEPTDRFAALNGVKPQSVRAAVCKQGSYHGVKPRKLKSGRLMWPAVQVVVDMEVPDADAAG